MVNKKILKSIFIYPVKSLPGLSVNTAAVELRGLKYDRRWMLVDENNVFITIRKTPGLFDFKLTYQEKGFGIYSGQLKDKKILPFDPEYGTPVKVKIWNDIVKAYLANREWDAWFSEALGKNCRLVFMGGDSHRLINSKWQTNNEETSFADGYPILLVGQKSLEDIQAKTGKELSILRFRPNFLIEGGGPYEEFRWSRLKIGPLTFQGLKPCARCVVTTIDPVSGQRGAEPLKTLAAQKIENKVVFGQHGYALETGTVSVGDKIEIISLKYSPYAAI